MFPAVQSQFDYTVSCDLSLTFRKGASNPRVRTCTLGDSIRD